MRRPQPIQGLTEMATSGDSEGPLRTRTPGVTQPSKTFIANTHGLELVRREIRVGFFAGLAREPASGLLPAFPEVHMFNLSSDRSRKDNSQLRLMYLDSIEKAARDLVANDRHCGLVMILEVAGFHACVKRSSEQMGEAIGAVLPILSVDKLAKVAAEAVFQHLLARAYPWERCNAASERAVHESFEKAVA